MKGFVRLNGDGTNAYLNVSEIAEIHTFEESSVEIKMKSGERYAVKGDVSEILSRIESGLVGYDSDVTENVWIPVENGLPDSMKDVWIAYRKYQDGRIYTDCIGYYDAYVECWCISVTDDPIEHTVTHWRPIKNEFVPGGTR
mgnify:FL=1